MVDVLTTLGVARRNIVQFQHDRAASGLAAVNTLINLCVQAASGACISHTLDHCGERILLPTAQSFFNTLLALFSRSLVAKRVWASAAGKVLPSKSQSR